MTRIIVIVVVVVLLKVTLRKEINRRGVMKTHPPLILIVVLILKIRKEVNSHLINIAIVILTQHCTNLPKRENHSLVSV